MPIIYETVYGGGRFVRVRCGWTRRCARQTASGRRRTDAVVDGGGHRVGMGVRGRRGTASAASGLVGPAAGNQYRPSSVGRRGDGFGDDGARDIKTHLTIRVGRAQSPRVFPGHHDRCIIISSCSCERSRIVVWRGGVKWIRGGQKYNNILYRLTFTSGPRIGCTFYRYYYIMYIILYGIK